MKEPCHIESSGSTVVVTLRGELDAHDAPGLRSAIADALDDLSGSGQERVVFDLRRVTFLDSSILGTMIGAVRRLRESGTPARVVLPETPARRIFELTGLERILDVYPSRQAALESPEQKPA